MTDNEKKSNNEFEIKFKELQIKGVEIIRKNKIDGKKIIELGYEGLVDLGIHPALVQMCICEVAKYMDL